MHPDNALLPASQPFHLQVNDGVLLREHPSIAAQDGDLQQQVLWLAKHMDCIDTNSDSIRSHQQSYRIAEAAAKARWQSFSACSPW
jgi:hypothetical protein